MEEALSRSVPIAGSSLKREFAMDKLKNDAYSFAFFVNCCARDISAVELKCVLGDINAQCANSSHVDLPSEVRASGVDGDGDGSLH